MGQRGERVNRRRLAPPPPAAATTHAPPAARRRRLKGRCTCDCRARALLPARRLLLLPATRLLQSAQGVGEGNKRSALAAAPRSNGCRHYASAARMLSPAGRRIRLHSAAHCRLHVCVSAPLQLLSSIPSCVGLQKLQERLPGAAEGWQGWRRCQKTPSFALSGGRLLQRGWLREVQA
jgi:hypothetical protein